MVPLAAKKKIKYIRFIKGVLYKMPEMLKIIDSRTNKIVKYVIQPPKHFELKNGVYVNRYRDYEYIGEIITIN
jgi:hypothetical protein